MLMAGITLTVCIRGNYYAYSVHQLIQEEQVLSVEMLDWGEDSLEYGYILKYTSDGGWWHMHIGRSACYYHCDLLGRQSNIMACIQRFRKWAYADSSRFYLTLDGEGVELPDMEVQLDCHWGMRPHIPELNAEALHFQQEVMPLLYDSKAMQRAVVEVISRMRHLKRIVSGKLRLPDPADK